MKFRYFIPFALAVMPVVAIADGPDDNKVENVRPIPQKGVPVSAIDRALLEAGIRQLGEAIDGLKSSLRTKPVLLDIIPDVQIYHNAVRYALTYDEFFNAREIETAKDLITQGLDRAANLREGNAPWTKATGLVVRGYISKIDGSVQPYGLVIPESFAAFGPAKFRLDLWWHGRGETLSEVNFINERQRSRGEFTPPNTFVLHPYGRYCNANKFAGEVDTFEAIEHAKKHYSIDENRIAARGFSMGGAACWQFGAHFPGEWAAIAPGAGFAESQEFLKVWQNEKVKPTWFEQKLWHFYDSTDYAVNISNTPTIAYSGEVDGQRQAANIMAAAMLKEGLELSQIIGPKAGHFYEAGAKAELNKRMDAIMAIGRNPMPLSIQFTTWTLTYNKMRWLTLEGLGKHWERARVNAVLKPDTDQININETNVTRLSLTFGPGECPFKTGSVPTIIIDGKPLKTHSVPSERSFVVHLRKEGTAAWKMDDMAPAGMVKRPGLQGPIDDAFMDSFLMVKPTGTATNAKVGDWVAKEMDHAIVHWRRQFRGEARVKSDTDVTDEDIASANLVLWGDPTSNKVLARIADRLPVKWDARGVHVGNKVYAGDHHVPVLIYPNPLNPNKYIVLNSGFTYREYDYLNNARQVPRLPDWAVVDVTVPVSSRWPGGVVDAAFFGENWELTSERK